jgi:hypothetical protein
MKAMVLEDHCEIRIEGEPRKRMDLPWREEPLRFTDVDKPVAAEGYILVRVSACGICHTELDEIEGRLTPPRFPIILGHEIVGRVEATGKNARKYKEGDRVGIAWIHSSCGSCGYCLSGAENLCDRFQATGLHAHGGYAQYCRVPEDFAYPIPGPFSDCWAAPLLCAGVIGYRALRLSRIKPGGILGLYGFGASAHIAIQVASHWGCTVFVFTRPGQSAHQGLAKRLGAAWVGSTVEAPAREDGQRDRFHPCRGACERSPPVGEKGWAGGGQRNPQGESHPSPRVHRIPLEREGAQKRGQRDQAGCARVSASCRRDRHPARGGGIQAGRCQFGPPTAEAGEDPWGGRAEDHSLTSFFAKGDRGAF